ncbi:MAG: biotin transporter BioY [Spirochaetaceae bacterium]|nr:MAG: biotin transporter BioY [Spirochaetaceae bacterium]
MKSHNSDEQPGAGLGSSSPGPQRGNAQHSNASSTAPQRAELERVAATAAFTALITVGAYLSFPLPGSPVPVVVQNFFVIAAGMLLGPRHGLAAVVVYLVLGAVGFPVFSGASGGVAHLVGPTGGYLLGYLPAVFVAGALLSKRVRATGAVDATGAARAAGLGRTAAAAGLGFALVYLCGVPVLMLVTGLGLGPALAVGFLPFFPGDVLKAVAAVLLYRRVAPRLNRWSRG